MTFQVKVKIICKLYTFRAAILNYGDNFRLCHTCKYDHEMLVRCTKARWGRLNFIFQAEI